MNITINIVIIRGYPALFKQSKAKSFFSVLVLITIIIASGVGASAEFESQAGSAILMEMSTGSIVYEKNTEVSVPPASITKIMTLLLGFEAVEQGKASWDDMVPVSEKAWKIEGSEMFLEVDHDVKYDDLITGISVVSANDGCVALAEYLCGSEDAFVKVMNRRAKELGLTNTEFKNSTGLPAEGHVMSAHDIAILARYLIQNYPEILEIESKREFTFNEILQYNRNPLLGVFPGADGLKTGWTEAAGYCLVGTAKQDDMRFISVVLNTKNESERLKESQELLNYGFKNFEVLEVKKSGDVVDSIGVEKGKVETVPVKVDSNISIVVPSSRKNDIKFVPVKNAESIEAPIPAGTPAGKLEVQLDDKTLAVADISTAEDAERAGFLALLLRSIINFLSSLFK
jgi:D-alanyl-D-alanine carboxypeptidase (penicillin-binding protein 5/6)